MVPSLPRTDCIEFQIFHWKKHRPLLKQLSFCIGHAATAEILSELFGVPVQMNRINFDSKLDQAIVFKLNQDLGRLYLSKRNRKIGYTFKLMERLE